MANEEMKVSALKLGGVLGMAVLFATAPVTVWMENGFGLPTVKLSTALAKSGNSGSGSGNSGSGSSHSGGSDDSGHHSGTDDSGHHRGTATGGGTSGLSVVKIESLGLGRRGDLCRRISRGD